MKQLLKFFQNIQINTVLDVGTGSGDFIEVLKAVFPHSKITGIDPDTDSLIHASEKFPDVDFYEMDAGQLSFGNNTFDVASVSMALHHLPNVREALKEMQRVVKPAGWLIVNELYSDNLNPAQEVHKLYHHFRSTTHQLLGITHNATFKKNEIIKMVEEAGIVPEFYFDHIPQENLVETSEDIDIRVEKMKAMLEEIRNFEEYRFLKPLIDEFREKATRFGFQPATKVVIAGRVKK